MRKPLRPLRSSVSLMVAVHGYCRSILGIESVWRGKMLQLLLCCPRMNLLSFTLTTWKGAHPAARVRLVVLIGVANFCLWFQY